MQGENMRKTMRFIATGISVLILVLAAGCASTPPQQALGNTAAGGNPWVGLWEGIDTKGDIYSLHFAASDWEMYIESSGIILPFYRGTYTYTASRVTLQVTGEGNYTTMGWMANRDTFPPITGRLSGNVLSVPTFTEADLVKE
jgi:hypothetical protein